MKYYENISFLSHNGVSTVNMRLYLPEGEVVGIFQIVHGMAEHVGRYHGLALALRGAGFVVCAHDHVGHGASLGAGPMGYMARRRGDLVLVADALECAARVGALYPVPLVLMGHSMGSFVARGMIARDPDCADALILMGTGGANPVLPVAWLVASAYSMIGLGRRPNKALAQLLSRVNNRKVKNPATKLDWLTYNKDNVAAYMANPLCGFDFTSAGYRDLFRLMMEAGKVKTFAAAHHKLPILLISGIDDPVGDFGKGVKAVADRYVRAGAQDVTTLLLPNMRHEPLNEDEPAKVHALLRDWALGRTRVG